MDKKEMILNILKEHSCLTGREISVFIFNKYQDSITPASITGTLRSLYSQGYVGKSFNSNGKTVYWLIGR